MRGCFKSGCPSLMLDFGDIDFAVLQQGHPYPVKVMRADKPDFPTHLLVVYGAGATRPGDAELADRLKGPLSRRWLVSVERTDGSLKPYSNRQTHGQAPAATASVALNGSEADAGVQEAIETLKGFPGRRVLLFVSTRHGTLPDAVSEAAKSLFPVYFVDGGEKRWAGYWAFGSFFLGNGGAGGCEYVKVRRRTLHHGVVDEVRFSSAVKDFVGDSKFDYDLRFSVPISGDSQSAPLTLDIERATWPFTIPYGPRIPIQYGLSAELYTTSRGAQTRLAPPQKLMIQGLNPDSGLKGLQPRSGCN